MQNNDAHKNSKKSSPSLAFHLAVLAVLSFIVWKISDRFIALSAIPWGVIAILLAPIANSIALFHKLSETKKNAVDDLNKSETRRFFRMISRKRNQTVAVIIFQISIILYVAIISMIGQPEELEPYFKVLSNIAIISMTCSLYTIIPSILGIKEISDFEATIKKRKVEKKRLASALEKLAK